MDNLTTEDAPPPAPKLRQPWMPFILALILTVGFFSALGYTLVKGIPAESTSKDIVMMLVGQLTTVWAGSMGFFFYTTASSARKTEMIAQSQPVKID